jgi:hypothetical protein
MNSLSNLSRETRASIDAVSADEYQKMIVNGLTDADLQKRTVLTGDAALDKMPQQDGRTVMPTPADIAHLERDMVSFLTRYPQVNPSEHNVAILGDWLKARNARPTYSNLIVAFESTFASLELRVEVVDVTSRLGSAGSTANSMKMVGKPKGQAYALPQAAPKSVNAPTTVKVVKGADLSAAETSRLMQPTGSESDVIEQMSANDFHAAYLKDQDDLTPALILKRIERAVGEFKNACPDYDPSNPAHRTILEEYFSYWKNERGVDLPRDVATSYIQGWQFFKSNPVTPGGQPLLPAAETDEVVFNGRKVGKTNPAITGTDPTFDLSPQVRRKIRLMSSTEYYEWCAQHPEAAKELDKTGL